MTTPCSDADKAFEVFRRTGDADALAVVYDELAPGLLRLALKLLGDASAAEDVLQATFVTAIEAAPRHDGTRPVRPWLAGILANEVRAHRRRTTRAVDPTRLAPLREPSDPAQDAIDAELDIVVGEQVRELPDAWQQPVLLRVRQGLTVPEIAAALGRPAGTIRGQIARGIARLRAGLASALGVFGLARVMHGSLARVTHGKGRLARSGAATSGVGVLGGTLMVVSVLALVVWGLTVVWEGALPEPQELSALSVVADVDGVVEDVPLAVEAPPRATVIANPAAGVVVSDTEGGGLPARLVVVNSTGDRAGQAIIDVYSSRKAYDAYEPALRSFSADGAGVWEGVLEPGEAVVARKDRSRTRLAQTFATTDELHRVVELIDLFTLEGRVVDHKGETIAGTDVAVSDDARNRGGLGASRKPPQVKAGHDGSFAVDLEPGAYSLRAARGNRRGYSLRVQVPDVVDDLTLSVPGDWRITGRVVDASGSPVESELRFYVDPDVTVEPVPGVEVLRSMWRARTDAEGRFDVGVSELGRFHVVGSAKGHAPSALVEAVVSVEAPVAIVDILLTEPVSIAGRVVDTSDQPVIGTTVSAGSDDLLAWVANRLAPRHSELFGEAVATTDEQGAFVLEGLSSQGVYDLTVNAGHRRGGAAVIERDVEGGRSNVVIVDPGLLETVSLRGRVVEAATGDPVPHFELHLESQRGKVSTLTSEYVDDVDGRFTIDGLDAHGLFGITVVAIMDKRWTDRTGFVHARARHDLGSVTVPLGEIVLDGGTLDIRLAAAGVVDARLLDHDGLPWSLVTIRLREQGATLIEHKYEGRTDAFGHIVMTHVAPGTYDVLVDGVDHGTVEVLAGETTTVELSPVADDEPR